MAKEPWGPNENHYLEKVLQKMDEVSLSMEKLGIAEYVEMLRNPRRLFFINFWAGLFRGFGMAIGFTILAAIVIYFLQKIIVLNIPLIGDFIADLVNIVQIQLRVR
ncbi:MAG: DUF5665 domain-containing protein [Syntrophomonas sp.]